MILKLPLTFLFCLLISFANAQVQKAFVGQSITTSKNINGYLEYLPKHYNSGTVFPLVIYMHGDEGRGDGRTKSDLDPILTTGLPYLIDKKTFPESVTLNGTSFQFIVISPQYSNIPSDLDMTQLINYVIKKYKVNTNRIYLTGFSRGGGVSWSYAGSSVETANTLAALVPIAGAVSPSQTNADNIAEANLPVFATHNDGDDVVPVENTIRYVEMINSRNPSPRAKQAIFKSASHDAWTKTYDPAFKIDGSRNIYQWMLQYQRAAAAPLPVVLTSYKAFASGDDEITVTWSTSAETENKEFTLERSSDGISFTAIATLSANNTGSNYVYVDKQPLNGRNYYRLSQTDIDGTVTVFKTLQVSVDEMEALSVFPNPASSQLNIKLSGKEQGIFTVAVIGLNGAIVKSWSFSKGSQTLQQSVPVSELARGKYILQVSSKTFKKGVPFLKN